MAAIPADLRQIPAVDIARLGPSTTQESLGWTQCMPFLGHRLVAVGITDARPGFAFSRPAGHVGVVMAALEGSGLVRCGERWLRWPAGSVVRMPAVAEHRYCHSGRDEVWKLVWICYRDRDQAGDPVVPGTACTLLRGDATALLQAITSALRERQTIGQPIVLQHYAALIDLFSRRLIQTSHDPRLDAVWTAVESDLANPWTLGDLVRLSGLRSEALRGACHRALGRSPIAQVTHLRLDHAATLLAGSDDPVSVIAAQVGYDNPFAFSTAFKRVWGVSPATWRGRRSGGFIIPDR